MYLWFVSITYFSSCACFCYFLLRERAWQWYGWRGSMPGLPRCAALCRHVPGAPLAFTNRNSRRAVFLSFVANHAFGFDATLSVHARQAHARIYVRLCCTCVKHACNNIMEQAPSSTDILTGDKWGRALPVSSAATLLLCRAVCEHGWLKSLLTADFYLRPWISYARWRWKY